MLHCTQLEMNGNQPACVTSGSRSKRSRSAGGDARNTLLSEASLTSWHTVGIQKWAWIYWSRNTYFSIFKFYHWQRLSPGTRSQKTCGKLWSCHLLLVELMTPPFQSSSGPKFVQFTCSAAIATGSCALLPRPPPQPETPPPPALFH